MLGLLLIFFFTLFLFFYNKFTKKFQFWEKKDVPHSKPKIPFGNLENPLNVTKPMFMICNELYKRFRKENQNHFGIYIFIKPIYIPINPDYIKLILTKDFNHFVDRGTYVNEEVDPISAHLFSLSGFKWKNLRSKLTPTFTSGKMKMMFPTLLKCGEQMEEELFKLSKNKKPFDIKEIAGKYTTDVIGSCAFGIDCNSFKDPESEFRTQAKKVFQVSPLDNLKGFIAFTCPDLAKSFGLRLSGKDVSNFFMRLTKKNIDYRENTGFFRKDFMEILLELKKNGELNINEVAAQSFLFFIAGYETSSTTISFCLFELARNQDIQNKVREEIEMVLKENSEKITYAALSEMKYLHMVVEETLRKYPPLPLLNRQCVKDYKFPDGTVLNKGDDVMIPVYSMHYDPLFYSEPEKFDPERFKEDVKQLRHPYTYLPFGEGPRNCIGLRFGMMQTKVGLICTLKNFKLSLSADTQLPLVMDPMSFLMSCKSGIWLDAEKI